MRSELHCEKIFASINSGIRAHVNGESLRLELHNFTALVQRIFYCGEILISCVPDKVLNVLTYGSHCFDEIRYVIKQVQWP